jgi:hypothetical protein
MTNQEKEVMDFINEIIVEEHGYRLQPNQKLIESEIDSFSMTTLFLELDEKYEYFKDVPDGTDPFKTIDFENITLQDLINKCLS